MSTPVIRFGLPLAIGLAFAASAVSAERVDVFAAASLQTALDRIAADWQESSGDEVVIAYAGSSQLARQIEQGAPAAIFISASQDWMDAVEKGGFIDKSSRVDLLGNTLVLIGGPDAPAVDIAPGFDLAGRLGDEKLAMALVDSVPAGVYGKAALTSLGIWDAVESKVAQADNVRGALALVSTGNAPFGIVYATDANADPKVSVVGTFPADTHDPITYPAAITDASRDDAAARAFFDALQKPAARAVFKAEGFSIPAP